MMMRDTEVQRHIDVELEAVVMETLRRDADVRGDSVTVTVENRWLTLRGHADHAVQSSLAEVTASYVPGVRGVTNLIEVGR
jgi:osmotically-inducible protein OsmY